MYARVSTFEGVTEHGRAGRMIEERILPELRGIPGYKGYLVLADAESATAISVVVWESEEAMRASAQRGKAIREEAATALGITETSVREYDVPLAELV